MPTKSPDWDAVELDYRTGILTIQTICKKYDITVGVLTNAASSRGWVQNILTPEDEATVLGLSEQETPRFPIDSLFDNDTIKRQTLLTAGQMVRLHREDIRKMRMISSKMTEKLATFIETGDIGQLFGLLGKTDSAADLLEKLSRIMVRTVELEREAYGLSSMTIVPDEEAENQVHKDIKNLGDRLHRITQQKAQKVEEKPSANSRQNNDEASAEPSA